ncbi:MAG: 4Fe-4S binding protein [Bacteriovoracaceae bacterium]|nr:4Fe-4S binding protein [Bacteriovoracaceae bacterium]
MSILSAGLQTVAVFGLRGKNSQQLQHTKKLPRLKVNDNGVSECVSCNLCAEICPTKAISVEVESKIQMPTTLTSGPAPKSFKINEGLCLECSLCEEVCPVDAISVA